MSKLNIETLKKGIVQVMVDLHSRIQHPDVEARISRGLSNWVVSVDGILGRRNRKLMEEFVQHGGLRSLLKLAESREADLTAKKQVGTAIYHTFKELPQLSREEVLGSSNGCKPLLDMKRCADQEVSELAESCLNMYNDNALTG